MSKINQTECKKNDCRRKGFWTETAPNGEKLFCFRTRHNGENHAQKLTLEEIEEVIKKDDS